MLNPKERKIVAKAARAAAYVIVLLAFIMATAWAKAFAPGIYIIPMGVTVTWAMFGFVALVDAVLLPRLTILQEIKNGNIAMAGALLAAAVFISGIFNALVG